MHKKIVWAFFLTIFLLTPSFAIAKIGVGIGTGEIQVDQILKPGEVYTLPSVSEFNTGDVKGNYAVEIALHEGQKELMPEKDWFIFSPKSFVLEPGEAKLVDIKLNLPIRMQPGDYFAYIEGYPTGKSKDGSTTVGIAAAAKLYFTVEPANMVMGLYYKLITWWEAYQPWTNRVGITLVLLIVLGVLKRFLNIKIDIKKPAKSKQTNE